MKTEKVKISQVKTNPNNPRLIKDDKFKKLVRSVKEFPEMLEIRPIVVDKDNVVLGGNMRLRACKEAGLKEVHIVKADQLTKEQQREFIIKDNVGFGEWDWDDLANEWEVDELGEWGLDLPLDFNTELEAEEDDYDIPDEIKTDIVLGDLIEIGEHRLLCGDSTDSEQVAKLMNGEKADISFTSPPYNAGKEVMINSKGEKYNDNNDSKSSDKYFDLIKHTTLNSLLFVDLCIVNIQQLSGNKIVFIDYLSFFKNKLVDIVIWNKTNGTPCLPKNVLNSAFEYCLFFSNENKPPKTIKTAPKFHGNINNVYTANKQHNNEFAEHHKATFPIHLPDFMISKFSTGSIMDVFLGTGTTMVAAHQLNRKCYGMELDAKYCQVIVERMLNLDSALEVKINGKLYKKTNNG
tara:strand:- start:140 stop:1357 length:1218 start_codon:yes stop_codon:yes gene_type:complete